MNENLRDIKIEIITTQKNKQTLKENIYFMLKFILIMYEEIAFPILNSIMIKLKNLKNTYIFYIRIFYRCIFFHDFGLLKSYKLEDLSGVFKAFIEALKIF